MTDLESPYRPPRFIAGQDNRTTNSTFTARAYIALPLLGGFLGFAGYITAALVLESRNQTSGPILSYGQQAGLISLPISTMIGSAIGFGIALSVARKYVISVIALFAVAFLGSAVVGSMWSDQVAQYGRDPSEVVLYYPPMAAALLSLAIAVMIGVFASAAQIRRRRRINRERAILSDDPHRTV